MVFPVVMDQCDKMKVVPLCPDFFNPMDCSPPGSSVRGILQARILETDVSVGSQKRLSTKELMLLNCGTGKDS